MQKMHQKKDAKKHQKKKQIKKKQIKKKKIFLYNNKLNECE